MVGGDDGGDDGDGVGESDLAVKHGGILTASKAEVKASEDGVERRIECELSALLASWHFEDGLVPFVVVCLRSHSGYSNLPEQLSVFAAFQQFSRGTQLSNKSLRARQGSSCRRKSRD